MSVRVYSFAWLERVGGSIQRNSEHQVVASFRGTWFVWWGGGVGVSGLS